MNFVMVWMLVSIPAWSGSNANPSNQHPVVVERFIHLEECQRVSQVIRSNISEHKSHKIICIQARIAK